MYSYNVNIISFNTYIAVKKRSDMSSDPHKGLVFNTAELKSMVSVSNFSSLMFFTFIQIHCLLNKSTMQGSL